MLSRLWCQLRGTHYRRWERLPDGTPIFGCEACGSYVRRNTADVRPFERNADPRFRLSAREQHELRHRAVRLWRKIRVTKERTHLRGIQGGRVA